jgi:hypothetical protein
MQAGMVAGTIHGIMVMQAGTAHGIMATVGAGPTMAMDGMAGAGTVHMLL